MAERRQRYTSNASGGFGTSSRRDRTTWKISPSLNVLLRPADVFQMLLLGDVRLYDGSWVVVRHMGEGREFCEIGSQALCFVLRRRHTGLLRSSFR